MNIRSKWILAAVIGITVAGAGLLGLGVTYFLQYRSSPLPIYPLPDQPQVTITSPLSGSQHTLGSPLLVQVTATGPQKVEAVELYVNSKLVGTDTAPPGGSHFYQAEFLWSAPEEGKYILIAQVIGFEMLTGFSSPVQIDITGPPTAQEGGESTAFPIDNFPDLQPEGAPFGPETPPKPAEEWKGSVGIWLTSLRTDTLPNAPRLSASSEGCSAILSIRDLSENEEGFEIWRSLPNSPTWSRIALLASQSQYDWITYTDYSAFGQVHYYVSAFNSKGVQDSNLVHLNLDSSDCAPPTNANNVLRLKLDNVQMLIPVDKFYCYVSLDGNYWIRRPEIGFWSGRDADQEGGSFDIEIMSLSLTGDDNSQSEAKPEPVFLDCWGWQGTTLQYLGAFSPNLTPNQSGSVQVASDGLSALVAQKVDQNPISPEFFPLGGNGDNGTGLGVYDDDIHKINPLLKAAIDPSMPIPIPNITYDPDQCKSHLPPPFQNEFGQFLFCTPYPGFDLGDEGVNPQPYFTWNMSHDCIDGSGDPLCKPYEYWLYLAANNDGEVGFNVYDSNPEGFFIHHVNAPELFSLVIPPVPCSGSRLLWVQMWYYDGSSLLPTYGPPSAKHIADCSEKIQTTMVLDILFDEILLSNVDDGESAPQDVEVYGYLRASSESQTRYINFAPWNEQGPNCPDESVGIGGLNTGGGIDCTKTFSDGIFDLAEIGLSQANSYNPIQEDYKLDNNKLLLSIEEYDSLTLSVKLVDWDDGSDNDLVCQGSFQIPSQSIFDWYQVKDQKFGITGPLTDSGYCQIKGIMNAHGP